MSGYDEIDEKFYVKVRFGVLLVSEAYGVETFAYSSEEDRDEGLRTLCSEIEASDDFVDRDIAIIRDGEIQHVGTWDGEAWEMLELPNTAISVA